MNLSPQLTTLLQVELARLDSEIAELNKQAEPIRSLLSLSNPEPQAPPFPYRTEPLAPVKVVPKVKLKKEFDLFCKPRVGQVISVKSFKAYLSANFPEGSYREDSAGMAVHWAYRNGRLDRVVKGGPGGPPTTYRIKEVAA